MDIPTNTTKYLALVWLLGIPIMLSSYFLSQKDINHQNYQTINADFGGDLFRLSSFTYTNHNKLGKHVATITADEFSIGPKRFGIFFVRALTQSTISNIRMEAHMGRITNTTDDHLTLGETLHSLHDDFEMLSMAKGKTRIHNLTLRLHRDGLEMLLIMAKQAEVNLENSNVQFAGASIKDLRTGRHVSSRKIIWNQSQNRFEIPGKYLAGSAKGQAEGRGLYVDLDFNLNPASARTHSAQALDPYSDIKLFGHHN